jgi:type I restriction enzyme, S subunit
VSRNWPIVRLGDVLRRSEETIALQPDVKYQEITVRLWGKGVIMRKVVTGAEVAAHRRFIARADQLVLSRIDARNGALGIVPKELDGAIVTNDFPVFNVDSTDLLPSYLGWLCRTFSFVQRCQRASEGTTNRVRLQENKFLTLGINLPPLSEQQRVVAKIQEFTSKTEEVYEIREAEEDEVKKMLRGAFDRITDGAPRLPMREVAPQMRRPIKVELLGAYPELGIRSFGNGTFHKPALSGSEIGNKRIFKIEPGDLVFSNVFAWEGAIAVAKLEDAGRVGSHRYITCVPKSGVLTPSFLCFYFLTPEGLEHIGRASPGGAGRNRTLGLNALDSIQVPVATMAKQQWFDLIQVEVDKFNRLRDEAADEMNALLPAILDRAFKGEL